MDRDSEGERERNQISPLITIRKIYYYIIMLLYLMHM